MKTLLKILNQSLPKKFHSLNDNAGKKSTQPFNPNQLKQSQQAEDSLKFILEGISRFDLIKHPRINKLAKFVNDKIIQKKLYIFTGPVNSITFSIMAIGNINQNIKIPAIIVPINWINQVVNDPINQSGGVIFTASQVQDFFTDKITGVSLQYVTYRAKAWEAEFLKETLTTKDQLNSYQSSILNEYPDGIETESIKHLIYDSISSSDAN